MGNFISRQNNNNNNQIQVNKKTKTKKEKEATNFFDRQKQLQNEREKSSQIKYEMARNSGGRRVQAGSADVQSTNRNGPADPARPPRPLQEQMVSYDQEMIDRMKHQLRHDSNAFLLNNIMLSVQFFDNYERVIWDLKNNSVTESDRKLNDNMAQHHKHVFLPDKLQEEVHAHVRVRMPTTDEKFARKTLDALQPQRMYVIHDNVEVNEPGEVADYSTVLDAPYYRMLMEEDDEPGFVRLKKLEILENKAIPEESIKPVIQKTYSSTESELSDDSETKDKEEITEGKNFMNELKEQINKQPKSAFKKPENVVINTEPQINGGSGPTTPKSLTADEIVTERRPSGILKNNNKAVLQGKLTNSVTRQRKKRQGNKKPSPSGSESSGYKTSNTPPTESSGESDYGYAKITAETTPRKLKISEVAKLSDSTSIIPARCITVIEVKKQAADESDDEDDDDLEDAYKARYGSELQRDLYKKMYYLNSHIFMNNFTDIFLLKLAQSLGFTVDSLDEALTQGASIYCYRGINKMSSFEVLPALNSNWPNVAQSWVVRRRNIIRNPRTSYVYQWPTQHMVGKAKSLGCLIVPLGFRPSRGTNKEMSLQWRLTFPAIERYLETCLAHSHVRCHLFATLLFRMFIIKNENSKVGLDYSHIRNHLFWQCEDNYAMWPEDRLGETLRIFLKSFYQQMMKANMPDYFVPQCNILKGIPKTKLLKQQRSLADIIESPVMHLLSALKNLKYVKNNFYPVFNYKKLYKILTCDDILSYVNPNLPRVDNKYEDEESDEEQHTDRGFWNEIKQKDPGYKWRKEQFRQHEAKKAAEAIVNITKTTKEPVDRKIILPSSMDPHRRRLILELFIPHFMKMAEYSENFQAMRQGIIYLEHASRLAVVLKDEPGGEPQGKEYISNIREKIDILKSTAATTGAPRVPKRNESFNANTPRPGTSGLIKAKSDQYINLQSVNSDNDSVKEPMSPTKKLASIVLADVHVENEKPKSIRAVSFQTVNEESENDDDDSDEGVFESKL